MKRSKLIAFLAGLSLSVGAGVFAQSSSSGSLAYATSAEVLTGTAKYKAVSPFTANAILRDATNLNAGTVPAARLTGSYAISISGNAATATDAGTLDALDSLYFTNATNLASGTVPAARLSGSYAIDTTGLFDGQEGSYYLSSSNQNAGTLPVARMPVGSVIGFAKTESTAASSSNGSQTIPWDATIPQNTEGVEYFTVAYTPKESTSLLEVEVFIPSFETAAGAGSVAFVGALFRDSTAGAVAAAIVEGAESTASHGSFSLRAFTPATAITATTFKFRFGADGTNDTTNIRSTALKGFGTATVASITVKEIKQ